MKTPEASYERLERDLDCHRRAFAAMVFPPRGRNSVEHVTNTRRLRLDESGCARTVNGLFWIAMTEQGDPVTRRQPYSRQPTRRRNKLAPDPDVRRAIIAAASKSVREHGVRGLSVATVLARAQLSTRAFYRHFESKDQLVAAVFLEMTRIEVLRLRRQMAEVNNPIRGVAAWVDGRLDLAFDEEIKSELRQVSLEAQSRVFSSPELISRSYSAILEPLVEQLQRGMELGLFEGIVPATAAKSIHGVVWAATQRQWATNHWQRDEVRERVLRFCLRGLGVVPVIIERVTAPNTRNAIV